MKTKPNPIYDKINVNKLRTATSFSYELFQQLKQRRVKEIKLLRCHLDVIIKAIKNLKYNRKDYRFFVSVNEKLTVIFYPYAKPYGGINVADTVKYISSNGVTITNSISSIPMFQKPVLLFSEPILW